ncbi:MAG: DUF4835 family protein [Bacteroidetes bacterium]|nr:DUF4835 family protein [Bacteroidota bacterium]MDA0903669.1 DUF4835 family protein [Bacteroidota bacterium]MDA1242577.1 DUF4835 family protein [Bacteroidota bacterium]
MTASSQELNCTVTVIAPQISNVDASRFDALEEAIREFLNGRRWTDHNFEFEERIECTMQLTISEVVGSTVFKGSLQVQSSRPVFNADYNTPVLLVNDGDIQFEWLDNSAILFNPGQHRDNLSSLLAYYSYMILGMDYDTFGMEGGTPYFLQAQAVVANAQNAGETGWRASQSRQNRYWLVENHLSQTFRPVRTCLYNYHRKGMDMLFTDIEGARLTMAEAIIDMRSTNRIRPGSYNIQIFFSAKSDEIIDVFEPATEAERVRLLPILKQMDPGNIQSYDQRLG